MDLDAGLKVSARLKASRLTALPGGNIRQNRLMCSLNHGYILPEHGLQLTAVPALPAFPTQQSK